MLLQGLKHSPGESKESEDNKTEDENQKVTSDENYQNRTRPRRKAGIEGENKRRLHEQCS